MHQINKYWSERGNFSIHNDLLLGGNQLVIPACLQRDILCYLHDGQQVIDKTRTHASSSVWWPRISRNIEKMVKNCKLCQGRIEPMIDTEFPDRPWSRSRPISSCTKDILT